MIKKLHHNAYRCRDSEETRRFYEDFLGLPLSGTLEESLFLGAYYRHYVRVGDAVLMVDGPVPAAPGPVRVSVPPERTRVFPAA